MDGGVWWAAVHAVTKSYTTEWLHFHFSLSCIWEGNGNPLQGLFWRIPGMGEPGGLLSMGSHRVGHNWSDLAAAAAAVATRAALLLLCGALCKAQEWEGLERPLLVHGTWKAAVGATHLRTGQLVWIRLDSDVIWFRTGLDKAAGGQNSKWWLLASPMPLNLATGN